MLAEAYNDVLNPTLHENMLIVLQWLKVPTISTPRVAIKIMERPEERPRKPAVNNGNGTPQPLKGSVSVLSEESDA